MGMHQCVQGNRIGKDRNTEEPRGCTTERAEEILALCTEHGIEFIIGLEPDEAEDISDIERALQAQQASPVLTPPKVGRNEPCPCGSGKKFKKCCKGDQPQTA